MSLAVLNSAFESAYTSAAYAPESNKARDPLALLGDSMPYASDRSFGAEQHADQLGHYRGRFYAASRIITHRIACQPQHVAQGRQRARRAGRQQVSAILPPEWLGDPQMWDVLRVHPLITALRDPNRYQTPFNMWELIAASLLVTGRGFQVALTSDDRNRAFDLWGLPSTWMHPEGDRWTIKPPGSMDKGITIGDDQVAHFYFADPANPTAAISPLAMCARAVLADEAIEGAQHAEFKNGPVPKVALIAGDVMNETSFTSDPNRMSAARPVRLEPYQRRQIITWYQNQFAGVTKHGLPIVLDAIIRDIKILSRKPAEMAFLESAVVTKGNIYETLGVSKILTGSLEGTNRAGGGLAEQFLVDNTVNPMIVMISQVMTKKWGRLFAMNADPVACWMALAEPRDEEMQLEKLRLLTRAYAITRNELRQRSGFNLPWIEGMDDVVIPQTMEEREGDEDRVGIGRLSQETPPAEPTPMPNSAEQTRALSRIEGYLTSLNGH